MSRPESVTTTRMGAAVDLPDPYPWYDSIWLWSYRQACELVAAHHPDRFDEFQQAFLRLHTRPDFEVVHLASVFDDDTLDELCVAVDALRPSHLEHHETSRFGRNVVHGHPLITDLQLELVERVSELVGEPVEPCYNFLSMYRDHGVCEVHMDAPEAKWTLDLCLRQSEPWPIHFSQIVDWPLDLQPSGDDWEAAIRSLPELEFTTYTLEPGEAIIFSGSSQWHYRDPQPGPDTGKFCDLAFFHFIPAGMGDLVRPRHWAEHFGMPELSALTH